MNMFRTRDKANAGMRINLPHPVTGEDTEHWVKVLSIDSDAYQKANTIAMRKATSIQLMDSDSERADAINDNSLDIIASLVVEWSFDAECTFKNVRQFLVDAPQIRSIINTKAADRAAFLQSNLTH